MWLFSLAILSVCSQEYGHESEVSNNQKIKLYACYTPSHRILKDDWFLPTLQDDYEINMDFFEQECATGSFLDEGWTKTTLRKVEMIIRAVKENWDTFFIYSDVDVQFFKPTQDIISDLMRDKDIILQLDCPSGGACTGFFACKGNHETLQLWQEVRQFMINHPNFSDQETFNRTLMKHPEIRWEHLPINFFGGGSLTGSLWIPNKYLFVPDDIVLHHANWTKGIKNKILQLKYVKRKFEKSNKAKVK